MLSVVARGLTWAPASFSKPSQEIEDRIAALSGQKLDDSNALRQGVATYLHCAGIEGGYGFFAPNVPSSSKLVFELQYDDGRVDYELPRLNEPAAGLRFLTLLEYIEQTDYDLLRQVMLKLLVRSVWQEHPDATRIRAVLGHVKQPSPAEAAQGKGESYEFSYAYDFRFRPEPTASPAP